MAGIQAREGKVFCCCVLDSFSRRIVGWSIDTVQDANLVVNALDMAIKNRRPEPGGIVHADHGTHVHILGVHEQDSLVRNDAIFRLRRRRSRQRNDGILLVLDADRDAQPEEVENTDRVGQRFYNRQRRHSGLGYRTPIEYELTYENQSIPA